MNLSAEISNKEKPEGYIPQLGLFKNVYTGNAVVKNHRGKAYMKIANTNAHPIKILMPKLTLEDFEEIIEPDTQINTIQF